jgi:hypothetical protein
MPRDDYPEIADLFYLLEEIGKGEYTFNIFKGNKTEHGIKFLLISIESKSDKAHSQLSTILNEVEWTGIYEEATDFSVTISNSSKTIRIIIFFEENSETCSFGLQSFIEKTQYNEGECCEDICNKYKSCKRIGRTYCIRINGEKSIGTNIYLQEKFEQDIFMENLLCTTKFVTTIRDLIFYDTKNITSNYYPKVAGV